MGFYRKKPVVIEAIQYTGNNDREISNFSSGAAQGLIIPFSPESPDIPIENNV